MKNFIRKSVLPLAITATLVSYSAYSQSKNNSGSRSPSSSSSSSSSKGSSTPNYGGSSSSSYKYNAPTYSSGSSSSSSKSSSSSSSSSYSSKPSYSSGSSSSSSGSYSSKPSYSSGSSSSSSSSYSKPNYGSSSSSSSYSKPTYNYGSSSSSSSSSNKSSTVTPRPSVPSYSGSSSSSSSSSSSKPNYGSSSSSGSYKYNAPTYSNNGSSSSSSSNKNSTVTPRPTVPSYSGSTSNSSSNSSKPNYGSNSSSGNYKYNAPTYSNNGSSNSSSSNKNSTVTPRPTVPSYSGSTSSNSRPNYGQSSSTPNYKYNDYTVSKPKYDTGKPVQNNNGNNSVNRPPQTNKNGTVLLKELKPGQSRVRADGTHDLVHKDGKGYTHTFTDKNGTTRKESIRYDKTGKEVKISDTARHRNGDVITTYKSGVQEVRTRDGLRYQNDRYGKPVYKEQYSSWNSRPTIQRHYNNNYTTIYVQNNYYGYPTYFYRPSYYDYNYYSYTLTPWRNPYAYTWHWSYNPWYYNYYRPYPTYYSPAYWLTDYLIMSLIQSNYERIAADREVSEVQAQYNNQVALSEAVKEEIRIQVESSLRQQQTAVQTNSVMDPSQILKQNRLMVVHDDLNVDDGNGGQCQLDEGDVLRLINQPTAENPVAELKVVSAKGTSCPAGTMLSLSAQNLIDMENEFQSRIQQGMTEMKEKKIGTTAP